MSLQLASPPRAYTNGCDLTIQGRVDLPDGSVGNSRGRQAVRELLELLSVGLQNNGIRALWETPRATFSSCMCNLCGHETSVEIWPDYDVVGEGIVPRGLTVKGAWCFSRLMPIGYTFNCKNGSVECQGKNRRVKESNLGPLNPHRFQADFATMTAPSVVQTELDQLCLHNYSSSTVQ